MSSYQFDKFTDNIIYEAAIRQKYIINKKFISEMIHVSIREKVPQRNITPILPIAKSNSRPKVIKNGHKYSTPNSHNQENQEKSASKYSKGSFEQYNPVVLRHSKIKSSIPKSKGSEAEPIKIYQINNTFDNTKGTQQTRRTNSNPSKKQKSGRENVYIGIGRKHNNDPGLNRKKSSGSGKIIFRPNNSRSHSKGDDYSLEKLEKLAMKMNVVMVQDWNKNTPQNYYTLKMKNKDTKEKKKEKQTVKSRLLTLDINIKGQQALDNYEFHGELGKGAYGVVKMGVNKKTGNKVAIKVYPKKHLDELNRLKNLERQINILAGLDHPIIAKLIEAIQTPTDIFLVLEYGGANSLYNYLLSKSEHRLKQHEAKLFLKVIAQTICYLHRKNIVHRDIKAQNILINRYKELKLIDFGFSIHSVPPSTIDTFCGTPTYMAPQIVSKIDHVPIYTDMWSLGILYYVMLQGNYPFRSRSQEELFEKIKKGRFQYIHHDISDQSKKLIEQLLQVNPYNRLTVQDILSNKWSNFFESAHLQQNYE